MRLAGRELLVPDRIGYTKGPQRRRDPRRSVAASILDADVVAEGDAERETDPTTLTRLARGWADQGGLPNSMRPGPVSPPRSMRPPLGPPPWNVYRIKPHSVTVTLGTEPGGLTRSRF